jgi:hypothetical protein
VYFFSLFNINYILNRSSFSYFRTCELDFHFSSPYLKVTSK